MPTDTPRAARRALILALLCGVGFMVTLDLAIVNVALPTLQRDLGVEQDDLQWVVITYGLTLGGFLLLGGRAADLLGRRKVLVAGLALFTAASLAAGLSGSLELLVAARAAQGLGAALAAPAALSTLTGTFAEGPERTRALGIFGAVGGSAAAIGVMLGGALTSGPGWEWTFLVNVPVGVALITAIVLTVPADPRPAGGRADVLGAVLVTSGLMAVVYAINKSVDNGWTSPTTVGFVAGGLVLLALFVAVERRAPSPLLPLGMLRRRTLTWSIVVATLVFGSFLATIFQASLFMQQVLGYSAMRTGLAYLAIAGTAVVVAAGVAAPVVGRLGAGSALALGQTGMAVGLLWLARVPVDADYWTDLFPGFVLVGVGIGFSGMAAQVAAFIGVDQSVAGLAGGLVETAREVGGALGTAVVATVAVGRAGDVLAAEGGVDSAVPAALTEGFQRGSLVAAGLAAAAALAAAVFLRPAERDAAVAHAHDEVERPPVAATAGTAG
jgi:EmrB/QacA subfamily drug resistance transporter